MNHVCIVLSGLSGAGKTTLGMAYAKRYGYDFVDGDSFFLTQKPKVRLSDGSLASNWDDVKSIDWESLNRTVIEKLNHTNVILVTFMPRIDLFEFPVYRHIRLFVGNNQLEKCIEARRVSKKLTNERIARDEMMVREYVYPEYLRMSHYPCDGILLTYNGDIRKTLEQLLIELHNMI